MSQRFSFKLSAIYLLQDAGSRYYPSQHLRRSSTVKSRLMNWPALGLFKISGTKKTKLLRILERQDVWPIINSEIWPIVNRPSPGQFIKGEILRYWSGSSLSRTRNVLTFVNTTAIA